jgi:glycerophosphoryl diester phosphodiesterase
MAADRKLRAGLVAISAHSGGSEQAQAATYEAYKSSLSTGAEYVEFDIRKTADDVLVVYHHARSEHTGQLVASLNYKELCDNVAYTVPRVDEIMRLLSGKVIGHLDLKEIGYEEEVISLAMNILGSGNFVVTTLEDISVANIKRSFPDIKTALSLGRDLKEVPRHRWGTVRYSELFPLRRVRACGADWVAVNHRLARLGILELCRRHGIGTMVWTVNSDSLIDRFLTDRRVNVLITDRPQYAKHRRIKLAHERPMQ